MMLQRKISLVVFLTCLIICGGCGLFESAASNVQGWDISACVDGFSTCFELFRDNADKFEGGFVEALDALAPE